jgi:hypothetical protein
MVRAGILQEKKGFFGNGSLRSSASSITYHPSPTSVSRRRTCSTSHNVTLPSALPQAMLFNRDQLRCRGIRIIELQFESLVLEL